MDILSVQGLTFGYKDCPVFDNFSCNIKAGTITRLAGINGAGKTTLLKCMTALVNQGKCIYYKGTEIANKKSLLSSLSYAMSDDTLYDYLTVEENINFYRALFQVGSSFTNEAFRILRLLKCDQYLDFLIKNLSQGTRSKVYTAICLAKPAEVYLLDEPFTALDKQSQSFFCKYIQQIYLEQKKTFVLVTHIDEFQSLATDTIQIVKKEA